MPPAPPLWPRPQAVVGPGLLDQPGLPVLPKTGLQFVPVISPGLELSQFGTFTGVTTGTPITLVTLNVNQFTTDANIAPLSYELWDFTGTPALLGTAAGTVSTTSSNVDTANFTGVTYPMLGTLRVRIYAAQGTATSGAQQAVGWASLTVTYSADTGTGLAVPQRAASMRVLPPQPPGGATFT
jgi:hypothetical protein